MNRRNFSDPIDVAKIAELVIDAMSIKYPSAPLSAKEQRILKSGNRPKRGGHRVRISDETQALIRSEPPSLSNIKIADKYRLQVSTIGKIRRSARWGYESS
jgi:hypothetical protein